MASVRKRTYQWQKADGTAGTGTRWEAQFRDRQGRQRKRIFDLKRDAQKWLDEQNAGLVTGLWVDPQAGKETFRSYARRWQRRHVGASATQNSYGILIERHLIPALGGFRMDGITRHDVQELVRAWVDGGAAPTTVVGRYNMLAIVLRAAVKDRVIPITPCEDIVLPRIAPLSALVPISTETVLALHDAIEKRYRCFVVVAAGTGARRGELLGLTVDRVNRAFGRIRIDRQLSRTSTANNVLFSQTKTPSSVRNIDTAPVVFDAIDAHLAEFGAHPSGLVFTNMIGAPLATSSLQRAWSVAAAEVGTEATPHALRHYYASMQIAGGCSIKKLQEQLGHKSATETWDTYGHLIGDEDDRCRSIVQTALGTLESKLRARGDRTKGKAQVRAGLRDGLACKPGSVTPKSRRPSISDHRCRWPPAVYPDARAGSPRTHPV